MNKTELKKLLSKDFDKAIEEINNSINKSSKLYNDFIHCKSRFNDLKYRESLAIITDYSRNIEMNQIRKTMLNIIEEIELNSNSKVGKNRFSGQLDFTVGKATNGCAISFSFVFNLFLILLSFLITLTIDTC